jgi:16S rRNA (cytosine1402-N4)-methyltransferase
MSYRHVPVMRAEVLEFLNCRPGRTYVDATLGGSGHARAILERTAPDGLLVGLDQDADAIANAEAALRPFVERVRLVHANFARLPEVLAELGIPGVDGLLLDLGVSLHHYEGSGRGFSFQKDEPLDMRMDVRSEATAADIIADSNEDELRSLFLEYGEERFAGRIARRIVAARRSEPIRTSAALARIVAGAVPGRSRGRIHPATRVFMALRIAVNRELERLEEILARVPELLLPGGRICVLTFHSLEDRIVKQRLKALEVPRREPASEATGGRCLRILTRKVVRPSAEETAANPPARSTKLRAAERV